jgi:uncharacterized protein
MQRHSVCTPMTITTFSSSSPSAASQSQSQSAGMIDDLVRELREKLHAKSKGGAADREDEVAVIETHISWVLLAGREVFKIKKPVSFPFLDFSTFEARERACRTETHINRRLAPRVYQGVVPVRRRSDGRFTLGAAGSIVDWAVHMLRLDEDLRADRLLERGELTKERIDTIACALAEFHINEPSEHWVARFGSPALVEQHLVENFATLRSCPIFADEDDDGDDGRVGDFGLADLERWQLAFVRGRKDLFNQRVARGFVRDGHGDLRLEHVFLHADDGADADGHKIEVIDGIEFNDRYRFADVCSDIAFLAMDLGRLGRVDLAERLLATYARETNDFDLYYLVDFYESYRACVRAKIAAIAGKKDEARRYLLLAQSSRQRYVIPPVFIAIAGGIATGKSSLAQRLGEELSAPIVDADRTRKFLVGLAKPTEHRAASMWNGIYDPHVTSHVYTEVLRRAGAILSSGRPVIVDASFRSVESRALARAVAEEHNVPFRLIECVCPIEVCRERLTRRVAENDMTKLSVSDAGPEILDAFAASFEPIVELCATEHSRISTEGTVEEGLRAAQRIITTWPKGLVQ